MTPLVLFVHFEDEKTRTRVKIKIINYSYCFASISSDLEHSLLEEEEST